MALNDIDGMGTTVNGNLSWVWKIQCHARLKFFFWKLGHDGIACNGILASRNIPTDGLCPLCAVDFESPYHLFVDCNVTKLVWQAGANNFKAFALNDFFGWLRENVLCSSISNDLKIPHGTFFTYIMWHIWVARNKKVFFSNEAFSPSSIIHLAMARAAHLVPNSKLDRMVSNVELSWTPPESGWFKLNVDGSCIGTHQHIAAAGIIRNSSGHWVSGIAQYIGVGNSIQAELWGLLLGLKRARELGIQFLHVLPTSVQPMLSWHVFREKNCYTDNLAKHVATMRISLTVFDVVPDFLFSVFWADLVGISRSRRIKNIVVG
ncbi:reverse transcriptase [Senna tora]|uniref:Reverse transcriptase n=1 Tax=Senna tora TaxID=362788 RepID=A0A834T0S8_9FABA|nr:reverse transcriptase [Senna tora]